MVDRELCCAALSSASQQDADMVLQYWVTYAFLTVVESAINAVYWFPFYYVFKFVLVLWMALPQTSYGSLHPFISEYLHCLVVPRSSSVPSSSRSSRASSITVGPPLPANFVARLTRLQPRASKCCATTLTARKRHSVATYETTSILRSARARRAITIIVGTVCLQENDLWR